MHAMAHGPPRLLVVGSCNTDLVSYMAAMPRPGETVTGASFGVFFGGKGANQCVAAAQLFGEPGCVAMAGAVGDDAFGRDYLQHLADVGVDSSLVKVHAGVSSGLAPIWVDGSGQNSIVVIPGAHARITPRDAADAVSSCPTARGLLVQLEIPLEATAAALACGRQRGLLTLLTPAPVPHDGLPAAVLRHCDVLLPNQMEADALASSLRAGAGSGGDEGTLHPLTRAALNGAALLSRGPRGVVVTLGAHGCVVATADPPGPPTLSEGGVASLTFLPAVPLQPGQVVDTTGAGDAFAGALAFFLTAASSPGADGGATATEPVGAAAGPAATAACVRHDTLVAAAARATIVAAFSVMRKGAQASYPTRGQIPAAVFVPKGEGAAAMNPGAAFVVSGAEPLFVLPAATPLPPVRIGPQPAGRDPQVVLLDTGMAQMLRRLFQRSSVQTPRSPLLTAVRTTRLNSSTSNPSAVEEYIISKEEKASVPLGPGETMLYAAAATTGFQLKGTCAGSAVLWTYTLANLLRGDPWLLTTPEALGFAGISTVFTAVVIATLGRTVRYAVLTSDGLFLRVHTFLSSWGPAPPVEVPIRLLSLVDPVESGRPVGQTVGAVMARVEGGDRHLQFDKPSRIVGWVGGPGHCGTGLVTTPRGISGTVPSPTSTAAAAVALGGGAQPPSDSSSSSSVGGASAMPNPSYMPMMVTTSMLYSLPTRDREAIRRYALLVHVLSGRTVDPTALADGTWELESITQQLDSAYSGSSLVAAGRGNSWPAQALSGRSAVQELRYWRRAVDGASGSEYWWNVLTGATQWSPPLVDGRGPYEWHADLQQGSGAAGGA